MGRRTLLLIAALVVAALGTTGIFLYVNGVDERAEAGYDLVEVLVATTPIAAGTSAQDAAGRRGVRAPAVHREQRGRPHRPQRHLRHRRPGRAGADRGRLPDPRLPVRQAGREHGPPDAPEASSPSASASTTRPGWPASSSPAPTWSSSSPPPRRCRCAGVVTRVLLPSRPGHRGRRHHLVSSAAETGGEEAEPGPAHPRGRPEEAQKLVFAQNGDGTITFGLLNEKSEVDQSRRPAPPHRTCSTDMTAIVDLDPTTAETLHAALGAESQVAAVPGRPAPAPGDALRRGRRRARTDGRPRRRRWPWPSRCGSSGPASP